MWYEPKPDSTVVVMLTTLPSLSTMVMCVVPASGALLVPVGVAVPVGVSVGIPVAVALAVAVGPYRDAKTNRMLVPPVWNLPADYTVGQYFLGGTDETCATSAQTLGGWCDWIRWNDVLAPSVTVGAAASPFDPPLHATSRRRATTNTCA